MTHIHLDLEFKIECFGSLSALRVDSMCIEGGIKVMALFQPRLFSNVNTTEEMSCSSVRKINKNLFLNGFFPFKSKQRVKGVSWGVDTEELVLQLLREACLALREAGDLQLDPKLNRNPHVPPWPPKAKLNDFEYTKIPPQLDTITRMDSH